MTTIRVEPSSATAFARRFATSLVPPRFNPGGLSRLLAHVVEDQRVALMPNSRQLPLYIGARPVITILVASSLIVPEALNGNWPQREKDEGDPINVGAVTRAFEQKAIGICTSL